jgi:hypothetical protein
MLFLGVEFSFILQWLEIFRLLYMIDFVKEFVKMIY